VPTTHRECKRVYNDKRWKTTRAVVRARSDGACVKCGRPGTICDHIDPLPDILEQGRDPFDADECQWLCHPCSGRKDAPRASKGKPKRLDEKHPGLL
jgi:5-methylcytosine-specific restriction endonuclease McrA